MEATYLSGAILILLFSVILHEVFHGLAALYFGDHTAKDAGRLTLNPAPHIDPIGTILVPALFILPSLLAPGTAPGFIVGWAKPVPVNPFHFRDIRLGEIVVSLAGIGANLGLAILATILFHLILPRGVDVNNLILLNLLSFTVTINLVLAVFNLLPLPPLDGSKVLAALLPSSLAAQYLQLERYGFLIILFLWFIPVGGVPILSLIVGTMVSFLGIILNIPLRLF